MSFIKKKLLAPISLINKFHYNFAGIGTSFSLLVHKPKPNSRVYSREYLENYSKNPNFEADRIKEQALELERQQEFQRLQHKANDKNSLNFIRVKQKNECFQAECKFHPIKASGLPLYSLVQVRKPKIIIQGVRRRIHCKLKKLIVPMRGITGRHIYDALALMASKNRKSWKFVAKTLAQVKNHAIDRGFDETRLYVVEAITGKHKRTYGVRFHGKGRGGRMKHDLSQLRIKLEERSYEDLFKQMYAGNTPPMLAYCMRQRILESNGGYEEIRNGSSFLTAKGRQQQKLMLKRRVFMTYLENLV